MEGPCPRGAFPGGEWRQESYSPIYSDTLASHNLAHITSNKSHSCTVLTSFLQCLVVLNSTRHRASSGNDGSCLTSAQSAGIFNLSYKFHLSASLPRSDITRAAGSGYPHSQQQDTNHPNVDLELQKLGPSHDATSSPAHPKGHDQTQPDQIDTAR